MFYTELIGDFDIKFERRGSQLNVFIHFNIVLGVLSCCMNKLLTIYYCTNVSQWYAQIGIKKHYIWIPFSISKLGKNAIRIILKSNVKTWYLFSLVWKNRVIIAIE